jgi:hypothetical protein
MRAARESMDQTERGSVTSAFTGVLMLRPGNVERLL